MTFIALGQKKPSKLPLSLTAFRDQIPEDEDMHMFLKGDEVQIRAIVNQLGGHFKYSYKAYSAVLMPMNTLHLLDSFDAIEAVHFELGQGQALLNESRVHTRLNKVHDGTANLPDIYKGNDVIIGFIDAGLDLEHPDFQFSNGQTRVLELWDQNLGYNAQRTPSYGYGQVFDSADINANNCPHQDQLAYYGHGTNTTGIGAGNGLSNEQFIGCAPEADIIVVSSKFTSFSWTATVADAVDYIFERAEFYGKPCVINASVGTYSGSHDGRDFPTQFIGEKLNETSGRIMVCAAGNSGEAHPYHLGYEASQDTSFTWFRTASTASAGNGIIFFELYGDVGDMEGLQFSVGADRVNPSYLFRGDTPFDSIQNRLFVNVTDTLWSLSGNYIGTVETWADSLNGTYRLQVYANHIDSIQYNFRLSTTGQGRLDLWSTSDNIMNLYDMVYQNLPSTLDFPEISNYKLPDTKQQIVSNWACSDRVVTVGNFTNRKNYVDVDGSTVSFSTLTAGALATTSSAGPNRLGMLKPEVVAPGDVTLTAGASFQIAAQLANLSQRDRVAIGGLHHRTGGTSSASPVVAGIAALFLEKCPNGSWQDFKVALAAGSFSDAFTGNVPNDNWGNGKMDAVNTLIFHTPHPGLSVSSHEFCAGETVELSVNGSFNSYNWNSGQSTQSITASQSGQFFAEVENELGCIGHSDTAGLIKRPLPIKPVLVLDGNNPSCVNDLLTLEIPNNYGSYLWSSGQTTNAIEVATSGMYFCRVKNGYGCANSSDSIEVDFYPQHSNPTLWHKSDDVLVIEADGAQPVSYNWYLNDDVLIDEDDSIYYVLDIGAYKASFMDENGCEWFSNSIEIGVLNEDNIRVKKWKVFPNPFSQELFIETDESVESWSIYSLDGKRIDFGSINQQSQTINLTDLSSGAYFIELQSFSYSERFRLIKL